MEGNHSGGGGMIPTSMGSSAAGMVGLDMSLTHHNNLRRNTQPQQHHFLPFPHHDPSLIDDPSQQQPTIRHAYSSAYPTPPLELLSEDIHEQQPAFGDAAAKCFSQQQQQQQQSSSSPSPSPWHRMKWTDNMVRLLIMIVYCIGDDGNTTGTSTEAEQQQHQPSSSSAGSKAKKTLTSSPSSAAAGLQLLQKKGKWKSVSRAMMEKGFYVSPQQCEDKFNDLNKRYKRVNELLGKGLACRVVENQALLDSLDHLSPKSKEEARKLLNSKHLFFREMCAYHNSGGSVPCTSGGGGGAPPTTSSTPLSQPPHPSPQVDQPNQQLKQHCFHHASADSSTINFRGGEALFVDKGSGHHGTSRRRLGGVNEVAIEKENHDEEEEEEEEEEDDDDVGVEEDYDDDGDIENGGYNKSKHHSERKESSKQEARGTSMLLSNSPLSASPPLSLSLQSSSPVPMPATMEQLKCDLIGSLSGMGEQHQRQWLKRKSVELEEQRLGYQSRALELERQKFKWLRFSSNKEQEMERMKLSNERLNLENDRMLLLIRQKEHDLITATANADHLHRNSLH